MSTRAAIIVKDSKVKNNLYRHCDGYPEGLGEELKEFMGEYEGSINPDSLANSIQREGLAEHTDWIHSDEDYLYIIDCEARKLICYNVGFAWEYHKKFTRTDGKTDYCAWRNHIDINNIEDPIIAFEFSLAKPKGGNPSMKATENQSKTGYTPKYITYEEARERAIREFSNQGISEDYLESYIQGYMKGYDIGYEEGMREAEEMILNRIHNHCFPNSKFRVKIVPK